MNKLRLFVPLTKIDEVAHEAWGTLAEEAPDRSGEIFDYESSKPYFEAWSAGFEKRTDGKSKGNLRAMHARVAAGKFTSVFFDDANKRIAVVAKILDSQEWEKTQEGVYTGFSIGGRYVKTWPDGDLIRYTAKPFEGSLVDLPCMYGATFSAIKDGGATELRKFRGPVQVWACADTERHLHAQKAAALDCATNAVKNAVPLEKGMYALGQFAAVIACMNQIRVEAKYEAAWEEDGSTMPDALRVECEHLIEVFMQMADEETRELLADAADAADDDLAASARGQMAKVLIAIRPADREEAKQVLTRALEALEKAGQRPQEDIQMDAKELENAFTEFRAKQTETLTKAFTEGIAGVEKKLADHAAEVEKKTSERLEAIEKSVKEIREATPKQGGPKLRGIPVGKAEDTGGTEKPKDDSYGGLMKEALKPERAQRIF